MSREERQSLDIERSRRSTGERERMWWEDTGPATLKYDPDLLGADESIDYSENYPNSRRMQKRGVSASLSTDHGDTLDESAYPLGISTVPKPSQPIPTLHRALSSDVPEHTRGSSSASRVHQPIRNALRDTTAEDVDLEDRYSHLISKQDGGNRGRSDMDIDLARQRRSGGKDASLIASVEYSSGGFLSQSAHSDVSLLIAGNRRSIEEHESNRTSLASQEASGVGNFPYTRSGRESKDWDRNSLDWTANPVANEHARESPEADKTFTAASKSGPKKDTLPFLTRVAADVALDSQLSGMLPTSPSREEEEEAYGQFHAYNSFESSLLGRPPPQPPHARVDVAPSGGNAGESGSGAGVVTGAAAGVMRASHDLDSSDMDLGASFQRLLVGLRQDEERIQRIIRGEEPDDGKGNMGPTAAASAGAAAAVPVAMTPVAVPPLITGIALPTQTPTKAPVGGSSGSAAAIGTPPSILPINAVGTPTSARAGVSPRPASYAIPLSQKQIEMGMLADVAAQEAQMRKLARYQEQWKMIGEAFAQQERARDGNMSSVAMHRYDGEHIPSADFERLEDRRRSNESISAIAGAKPVDTPQWEDRGQSWYSGAKRTAGASSASDHEIDCYGERMDLAALAIGAVLQRPFDPDALREDSFRNLEALAFEQARGAEIRKKHEDEHAVGPHKGQRWEGLRATDLFNPHQPPKLAAKERAEVRAKTSVPGLTAPLQRVGVKPPASAGQNVAELPAPVMEATAVPAVASPSPTPTRRGNSTRFDRSTGPASNIPIPIDSKLPKDVLRVFQKGKWEEIHHVADAVAATVMVQKAAHKFKVFQHGKWQHVLHDDSHQFVEVRVDAPAPAPAPASAPAPAPAPAPRGRAASPDHRKQVNATATDTVVSSIQTAVGSFLTGTLPGSPLSKSRNGGSELNGPDQAHAMAASLAIGVLGAGLHNARVKMQEKVEYVKMKQELSKPLAASFVNGIFERAASPKRLTNNSGKSTSLQAFPDIASGPEAAEAGYKVFMRGQWVVAEHHEDSHGIHTSKEPAGASVLASRKAAADRDGEPAGYKVFMKGQWVVVDHHADNHGISTATAPAGAAKPAAQSPESPREVVAGAAASSQEQLKANASSNIDTEAAKKELLLTELKAAEPEAFTKAELALQAEIERVRARLGPAYAKAVAAAAAAKKHPVLPSQPVCPSSPGRVHAAVEVSAISGGHVVVPPPLRPLSLAARSQARNWNVYSDDYVNDSNAAYSRWSDGADCDNDYDSNNLEKVMAHAPVTTDVAGRAERTATVLAAATALVPPTSAPAGAPAAAPEPEPAAIPSLVALSAAAVVASSETSHAAATAAPTAAAKKVTPPAPQSYFRFLSAPAENAAREEAKREQEASAVAAAAQAREEEQTAKAAFELKRQQQRAAAINRAYSSTSPTYSAPPSAPAPTPTPTPMSPVEQPPAPTPQLGAPCSREAPVADKDRFLSKSRKAREALMRQAGLGM